MKGLRLFISLVVIAIVISIILFLNSGFSGFHKDDTASNGAVRLVNIYDVVNDAFLYTEGFNDSMSPYMSKDVFNLINVYNHPDLSNTIDTKSLKIDFKLEELNQKEDEDDNTLYYVYMNYSIDVKNEHSRLFSYDNKKLTFKVRYNGDLPYIEALE
ncbi:hypothetical protein [Clostridium hydrogeniformans]|uniref:hypothetical protein n=1 Tax=Clostridium hydrogeniformans TaxID=349933 RepID=UPI00047F3A36|nr:hypothetical protein [Clostridium hydrogeniformans]